MRRYTAHGSRSYVGSVVVSVSPSRELSADFLCPEMMSDPTGEGSHPTRLPPTPTSDTSHTAKSPASDGRGWEVLTDPLATSMNLLEQFTELRKPVYLLGYWLIVRGYNSGRAGRGVQGKVPGKGPRLPCVHQPEAFLNGTSHPVLWISMGASLHKHD